jgi:tetratricopeptide (TPR) repeat protein
LVPLIVLAVIAPQAMLERAGRASRIATIAGITALGIVTMALAGATVRRNQEYASPLTLAMTALDRWPTAMAHQMVGEQLLVAGRREQGVAQLRLALGGAPRAHYALGVELYNEGKLGEAVAELREFVRLQPLLLHVITAQVVMAKAHARQQQWPEAIEQARSALSKQPGNLDARAVLADALFSARSYADAIGEYEQYLRARPGDVKALDNLGIALIGTGNLEAAIAVFRRAVGVNSRDGDARRNLAMALLDHRDIAEAAVQAREAAALRPSDPVVYDLLGQALALAGRWTDARAEFDRALQLDPGYSDAREHLARIRGFQ